MFFGLFVIGFDGTACWTMHRSNHSSLLWLSAFRRLCIIICKFIVLRTLNVLNDLAKAMKALDGKKKLKSAISIFNWSSGFHLRGNANSSCCVKVRFVGAP